MSNSTSRRQIFKQSIPIVLKRDKRTCQYCGDPGTEVDQWKAGWPSPASLVTACPACHALGANYTAASIDEKREWLITQRQDKPQPTLARGRSYSPWARGKHAVMGRYASTGRRDEYSHDETN